MVMEVDAVLSLYDNLFNDYKKKIAFSHIFSDNNSTMRVILKHVGNHPKGRLKDEERQLE